jgi:hypothetical protein
MSSGVELEIGAETLEGLKKAFGLEKEISEAQLTERVATKRFSGHIVLKGFSDEVVGSIADEVKIRIQAAHFGGRVRLIIDVKV